MSFGAWDQSLTGVQRKLSLKFVLLSKASEDLVLDSAGKITMVSEVKYVLTK